MVLHPIEIYLVVCHKSRMVFIDTTKSAYGRIAKMKHDLENGKLWGGRLWKLQRDWEQFGSGEIEMSKLDSYGSPEIAYEVRIEKYDHYFKKGYKDYEDEIQLVDRVTKLLKNKTTREMILEVVEGFE